MPPWIIMTRWSSLLCVPKRNTFEFKVDKFLHFYLTKRDVKANQDKFEANIQTVSLTSKKEAMGQNEILTSLNKFISKLVQHALPFYKLVKRKHTLNGTQNTSKRLYLGKWLVNSTSIVSTLHWGDLIHLLDHV